MSLIVDRTILQDSDGQSPVNGGGSVEQAVANGLCEQWVTLRARLSKTLDKVMFGTDVGSPGSFSYNISITPSGGNPDNIEYLQLRVPNLENVSGMKLFLDRVRVVQAGVTLYDFTFDSGTLEGFVPEGSYVIVDDPQKSGKAICVLSNFSMWKKIPALSWSSGEIIVYAEVYFLSEHYLPDQESWTEGNSIFLDLLPKEGVGVQFNYRPLNEEAFGKGMVDYREWVEGDIVDPAIYQDFGIGYTFVKIQADSGLPFEGKSMQLVPSVFKSYRSGTTRLLNLLDPLTCPVRLLPYLARLLGYNLKFSDFAVSPKEEIKKRVQIRELAKWYALKGVNRGFNFIFKSVGYGLLNPELAWVDKTKEDPRDFTAWNSLGVHPGDVDFSYASGGSIDPDDYVPDSRMRVDLSGQGSVPPVILESAKDRIREVKPYHLIFDFITDAISIEDTLWMFGRYKMLLDKSVTNIPFGDETTEIQVTDVGGGNWRYVWTENGTDPEWGSLLDVGKNILIEGSNFNSGNTGEFEVQGVTELYFEVTNAAGVAETVTLGSDGRISTPYLLDRDAQPEKFHLTMSGSQDIVRIREHKDGVGYEPSPYSPGPLVGERGYNGKILVVKGGE